MKRIVIDLDGTLTENGTSNYDEARPNAAVVEALRKYKKRGFEVVILTSRNMRTYKGHVGKINVHTLPTILAWLARHQIPHDEVIVGKPWCGDDGFYVDDKAVRPDEFVSLGYEEIKKLLSGDGAASSPC